MSEVGVSVDAEPVDTFATIPDVPIQPATERVNPSDVASGRTRGTQTYINQDSSYMTLGLIPDGGTDFGLAFFTAAGKLISKTTSTTQYQYNASGQLVSKNTGETQYIYDPTTGLNIMQIGKLPDGTYGWAVAASGNNVADGFS